MIDETTLAAVFAKAPPYSEEEITLVITKFRESRAQFAAGIKAPKATKPKAAKSAGPSVDLGDLEL